MYRPAEPRDAGIHIVYLLNVNDDAVAEYLPKQTELGEGRLGPRYEEWRALFFDVLHADTGPLIPADTDPTEFVGDIAGYPMLSKIKGTIYDATYTRSEVQQLRCECVKVKASCDNNKAIVALTKLIGICDLAIERNAALLLQGN